jgi:hypothetical protein
MSVAMTATTSTATVLTRRRVIAAGAGGGEHGKLLGQLFGTAVRALRSLPIAGADEDFAVAFAFFAMKLVNRHEGKITGGAKISSDKQRRISPFLSMANN